MLRRFSLAACAAVAALSLSSSAHAAQIFSDNLSEADNTVLNGKAPDVGGAAWTATGNVGAQTNGPIIVGNAVDTQGAARVITAFFNGTLAAGQRLTVVTNSLESLGGMFNGAAGAFAGYSLLDGANATKAFFGDVGDGATWTVAATSAGGAGKLASTDGTEPRVATFTYDYDTGASTLSLSGLGLVASGNLPAGGAINRMQIANNGGGDLKFGTITADISPIPEPASLGLLAIGSLGLLARRRRGA